MGFPLTDLKFFSAIQDRLDAVTPENLAELEPGKPVPENATVIGKLSPIMKALLWVRNDLAVKAVELATELKPKIEDGNSASHEDEVAAIMRLADVEHRYQSLFHTALLYEYPKLTGRSYGYGPNFEVYMTNNKKPPTTDGRDPSNTAMPDIS